jgi:kinesin family protein 6/9
VKVVIRTRPTADFASKNVEIDPSTGTITLRQEKDLKYGKVNN